MAEICIAKNHKKTAKMIAENHCIVHLRNWKLNQTSCLVQHIHTVYAAIEVLMMNSKSRIWFQMSGTKIRNRSLIPRYMWLSSSITSQFLIFGMDKDVSRNREKCCMGVQSISVPSEQSRLIAISTSQINYTHNSDLRTAYLAPHCQEGFWLRIVILWLAYYFIMQPYICNI